MNVYIFGYLTGTNDQLHTRLNQTIFINSIFYTEKQQH